MAITLNGTTGITTPAIDNQGNLTVDGGTIKLDGNYPVGTNNVALGDAALDSNVSGASNVAIGADALTANTASNNTAVGYQAGYLNTTGEELTAVGYQALFTNSTSNTLSGFGNQAGYSMTGSSGTFIGFRAGYNVTGTDNTVVGHDAMYATSTGTSNVAVGKQALRYNTTATNNTAVGYQAGYSNTTGANNTCIGIGAGYGTPVGGSNLVTGNANIYIGGYAHPSGTGNTTEIVIGYNSAGKGTNTGFMNAGGGGNYQGNNSSTWSQVSDRRLKKNIVDSTIGLAEINQLQVRNFEYLTADEITELPTASAVGRVGVQLGVIAQEIQAVLPNCVKEESTGVLSVDPDNLTWHLIKAVQELSAKNDALTARITALEGN